MQMHRLFEMVYLLLGRESVTAAELARRFEVSTRTIYRDLDALSAAGIPVYAVKGKGGGIRLLPDFVLNKALLSDEEQTEILTALQSLSTTGDVETGRLLSRLKSLFQKEEIDWIEVDFSKWGSGANEKEKFALLKSAILNRHIVAFRYCGASGGTTDRTVEPVKLHYKDRSWYLQAYCLQKKDYRSFKISRMQTLTDTKTPFTKRETPLPPLDSLAWGTCAQIPLELWFSDRCAFLLYDLFLPEQIRAAEDGGFVISALFPQDDWLYGFLLSFGENVKVLSPASVRQRLCEKAKSILSHYREESEKDQERRTNI